jgi:hypothetical protein
MKKKIKINFEALSYFSGGIPAGVMFILNVDELTQLVKSTKTKRGLPNIITEIAFIGLIAYFETFCKDQFSSLINLCPQLTTNLHKNSHDVSINVTNILDIKEDLRKRLGFYVAENYDFGTAKKINSLYQSLLLVTPFSKKEMIQFDQILIDRNLLVHHGGVYTTKYAKQQFAKKKIGSSELYFNSLVISRKRFLETAKFLSDLSDKIIDSTVDALLTFTKENKIKLLKEQKVAITYMHWII